MSLAPIVILGGGAYLISRATVSEPRDAYAQAATVSISATLAGDQ